MIGTEEETVLSDGVLRVSLSRGERDGGLQLSTWGVLLIALAVWAVSIPLAYALAERGQRGPAEVMLRQLTYGKGR